MLTKLRKFRTYGGAVFVDEAVLEHEVELDPVEEVADVIGLAVVAGHQGTQQMKNIIQLDTNNS